MRCYLAGFRWSDCSVSIGAGMSLFSVEKIVPLANVREAILFLVGDRNLADFVGAAVSLFFYRLRLGKVVVFRIRARVARKEELPVYLSSKIQREYC